MTISYLIKKGGVDQMSRKRKIPLRKCVVTEERKPKQELIRIVRNKEGEVFVDLSGKQNGRGAYVTKSIDVVDQAQQSGALNHHLKAQVEPAIYDELREIIARETNE